MPVTPHLICCTSVVEFAISQTISLCVHQEGGLFLVYHTTTPCARAEPVCHSSIPSVLSHRNRITGFESTKIGIAESEEVDDNNTHYNKQPTTCRPHKEEETPSCSRG